MDPREAGFALERYIQQAVKALHPSLIHRSEQEIKTELDDSTLNGVDHWITFKPESKESHHILVQTKWRETITQPEVAQFITCVDRIQSRIPTEDTVILLWACKCEPTKNSKAILTDKSVDIVCCGISIESLARCVMCWVSETLGLDPVTGFREIPMRTAVRIPIARSSSSCSSSSSGTYTSMSICSKVQWDETEEGKFAIQNFQQYLTNLSNSVGNRVRNALSFCGMSESMSIVNAGFPERVEDWWNGKNNKVNFNSILRALKGICVPTKNKNFESRNLFLYCKMRFISTELARHVAEYMGKRTQMIGKGSAWAKKVPVILCTPDPMTQEEFKATVVHCRDYWMHVNRAGVIEKVPSGIENQFFMNYYAN